MEETKRVPRRPHSEELKACALAECRQQGASVAKVAMSHGLNVSLVHEWARAVPAARAMQAATPRPAAIALTQGGTGGSSRWRCRLRQPLVLPLWRTSTSNCAAVPRPWRHLADCGGC